MKVLKAVNINRLEPGQVLTVDVNITHQFKVRMAIALALIKAAVFVLGCGIEIKHVSGKEWNEK